MRGGEAVWLWFCYLKCRPDGTQKVVWLWICYLKCRPDGTLRRIGILRLQASSGYVPELA
jgi:hypothetical protein